MFRNLVFVWCLLCGAAALCQEIPLGTWRLHASYNGVHTVSVGASQVYAASSNGVMVLDKSEKSIITYSRLTGLSSTGITVLNFDETSKQLLIAYDNGKLDVIKDNVVKTIDPFKTSSITGSRKINAIGLYKNLAYLATDFGIIVFDLAKAEIKETWRDLGATGQTLKIFDLAFQQDSIFLATENGVLAGALSNNLLDYHNYKRFNPDPAHPAVTSIAAYQGNVYAAINASGLYRHGPGTWTKESFLAGSTFSAIKAASNLLITADNKLWKLNTAHALTAVEDAKIISPVLALEDNEKLWIADAANGLVSDVGGPFEQFLPNGPSQATAFRLMADNDGVQRLSGGYTSNMLALNNADAADVFTNGQWSAKAFPVRDLTDEVLLDNGSRYYASFGYGLLEIKPEGTLKVYDNTNSPLVNINAPAKATNITALAKAVDGLWVANYGGGKSLHFLKSDNTWESYSPAIPQGRYPMRLVTDAFGYVWMVVNPNQGGGLYVYDKTKNAAAYLTEPAGSGGLPSRNVRSIAVDRDGYVWVGTDKGIAYFFDAGSDAVLPVFDNRFLLRDDKVTAIAVDAGNRKWIGTERGVWLFNPTGEQLVYNFTAENSLLLSNIIQDIAINHSTGEVFFATDKGIISFRGDATQSTESFQSIRIFPNPVTSNFSGTIGISGLATDAQVKITDIRGNLVWQMQANGGTATWNGQDTKGRRAATGVYLVFAARQDGTESVVGKIAVVD
jgi:hypothetical protein